MRLPSKSATFAILMVAAAISAFVLPARWTTGLRGLLLGLILLLWPASTATREVAEPVREFTQPEIPQARAHALEAENQQLKRALAQAAQTIQDLTAQFATVTGLRGQLQDGDTMIVIAPVVAYDANPRRDTLEIHLTEAARGRVRVGQWVAAGTAMDTTQAEASGRELLQREWLIGRVSEVHLRVARVQLSTDPGFRVEVRTACVSSDGRVELAREGCILDGIGKGQMLISQATQDYFHAGFEVVIVPASQELPINLSIGRINTSVKRLDSPQHFDLTVLPWGRVPALTHVYVICPEQ